MAIKELNEKQLKAIELLIKGETTVDIAKKVSISRQSLNTWRSDPVFKAELDKQVQALKSKVDKKLLISLEPLLDRLINIALKSNSDKTSLDAIIYAINRIVGTPTNKTQDVSGEDNKEPISNIDDMLNEIDNSKVVELPKAK